MPHNPSSVHAYFGEADEAFFKKGQSSSDTSHAHSAFAGVGISAHAVFAQPQPWTLTPSAMYSHALQYVLLLLLVTVGAPAKSTVGVASAKSNAAKQRIAIRKLDTLALPIL